MKTRLSALVMGLSAAFLALPDALAEKTKLRTAISVDGPPYVENRATGGLEVDIVRRALPEYHIECVQMPFGKTRAALEKGTVAAAVTVQETDDGFYYSDDYITFANVAISRKVDDLRIRSVDDLVGHRLLAWQGADSELGPEFRNLFGPGAPYHKDYVETRDPPSQVAAFWKAKGAIAVIDRSLFEYYSVRTGHGMDDADLHAIFPPVTNFKVGFKDAAVRDAFNAGLRDLCKTGEYVALLEQYGVVLDKTVCD